MSQLQSQYSISNLYTTMQPICQSNRWPFILVRLGVKVADQERNVIPKAYSLTKGCSLTLLQTVIAHKDLSTFLYNRLD